MYYIIRFDNSGVVMAVEAENDVKLLEQYPKETFKHWYQDDTIVAYEEKGIAELWSFQLNNDMWIQGREFK